MFYPHRKIASGLPVRRLHGRTRRHGNSPQGPGPAVFPSIIPAQTHGQRRRLRRSAGMGRWSCFGHLFLRLPAPPRRGTNLDLDMNAFGLPTDSAGTSCRILGRARFWNRAGRGVTPPANTTQVIANWLIGGEIVEKEQQGAKCADYGVLPLCAHSRSAPAS